MIESLSDALEKIYSAYLEDGRIGDDTPKNLALPIGNFSNCLVDTDYTLPATQYKIFRLIEDIGVRYLEIGNNSGGKFYEHYRSFRVEYNGGEKIVSMSTSSLCRWSSPTVFTAIDVAIDREKYSHHALQLVVDDNVEILGDNLKFWHKGNIAVGKFGSAKISELRELVAAKYPQIISGKKFCLGTLTNDRLWTLDDEQVIYFVENLISYAFIRDDLREIVIKRRTQT